MADWRVGCDVNPKQILIMFWLQILNQSRAMFPNSCWPSEVRCSRGVIFTNMEHVRSHVPKMLPINSGKWKEPETQTSLTISGGLHHKSLAVESIDITTNYKTGHAVTYVKLDKNAMWLLKIVGGAAASKGFFKKTTLFEDIRSKYLAALAAADDGGDGTVAVAADAVADDEDDDPMNALDCTVGKICSPNPNAVIKKPKGITANSTNRIKELEFPARARCAYPGDSESDTIKVGVIRVGPKSLYIDKLHVSWLCTYLADECGCCGVPLLPPAVAGVCTGPSSAVAESNCSVPGLYIRWDFQPAGNSSWVGDFVSGPMKGRPKVAVKPTSMTIDKFDKVKHWRNRKCSFEKASKREIKDASWDYIEWYCNGLLPCVPSAP